MGTWVIHDIDPPLPMETPKGNGWARFVIDYGFEHDLVWVIFMDNQQCWTVPNPEVRIAKNWTGGRRGENRAP
jgi:hypothetical protein